MKKRFLKTTFKSEDQTCVIKNTKKTALDGRRLLNFIVIVLESYLRLNTNYFMEKGLKY